MTGRAPISLQLPANGSEFLPTVREGAAHLTDRAAMDSGENFSGWEISQMCKIDFNCDNYGHRLMLALAIRDYTNTPGQTLAGKHNCTQHSLLGELEDAGKPTSKSNLDRLAKAPDPDSRDDYASNARVVAQLLQRRGYFPPGRNVAKTLKVLPVFFDGVGFAATEFLKDLEGRYHSYQRSNLQPDVILIGTLEIGPVTPWGFAEVVETIEVVHTGRNTLIHEGVCFADEEKNLYILARERNHDYPRFYLFDDCNRPDGSEIESIFGVLLGGARLKKRQISPIALHRGEQPPPEEIVRSSDMNALPEIVRTYLGRDLRDGEH